MALERSRANDIPLPSETLAEVCDGLVLAMDALGGSRVRSERAIEALAYLRWAKRRADRLFVLMAQP